MKHKFLTLILAVFLFFSAFNAVKAETDDGKTIAEKALTPVGYAIGAVIAPVSLGYDTSMEVLDWSSNNVIFPIAEAAFYTAEKALEGFFTGADYAVDKAVKYIIVPASKFTIVPAYKYMLVPAGKFSVDYILIPSIDGFFWGLDKTADVITFTGRYTIVPILRTSWFGISKTVEYAVIPLVNGIETGFEYTIVPLGKGLLWGAKYTVLPIAKGLEYTVNTAYSGMDWTAVNIIAPAAKGAGAGISAVIVPINSAAGAAAKTIKSFMKK